MKKMMLGFGVLIFSTALLSACGDKNDAAASKSSESSATVASSSKTVESSTTSENEANLEQAAKQLEEKFNTDSEKLVKVEINNNVADDTSDVAHSVIEVRVIDDESRKSIEEAQNALNSNTATDAQRTQIYGIQLNIEEVAKTLENENDIITFIVPATNGNNLAIAQANKTENIIPLVM